MQEVLEASGVAAVWSCAASVRKIPAPPQFEWEEVLLLRLTFFQNLPSQLLSRFWTKLAT